MRGNRAGRSTGLGNYRKTTGRWCRGGFTLLEILISVTIIMIISSMVLVNVGNTDASQRLDRAAQQVVAAIHYARMQAMSHSATVSGSTQYSDGYGVQIDTSANTVTVYHTTWNSSTSQWTLPGTAVANSLFPNGSYVMNLSTQAGCAGVTITGVQLTGSTDTSNNTSTPYVCQYKPFGTAENYNVAGAAAITLSYGGMSRSISVPEIGDPQEN